MYSYNTGKTGQDKFSLNSATIKIKIWIWENVTPLLGNIRQNIATMERCKMQVGNFFREVSVESLLPQFTLQL